MFLFLLAKQTKIDIVPIRHRLSLVNVKKKNLPKYKGRQLLNEATTSSISGGSSWRGKEGKV